MKTQTDFSKGNVKKIILELALPMTAAQLINLFYNIVDRMYIGRISEVGTLALTGLGLCFPIIMMISAFTHLLGSGGAPLSSIERGRGNQKEAENIMGTSFVLLVGCGLLLTLLGLWFKKPLLYAFGASADTFSYANDYLSIYLCGSTFVMIALGMNSFINNQGFAKTGMLTVLLGCIVNIILDPILIFGLQMGVKGAAYATVFSQCLSALWVMRFLTGKKAILTLRKGSMKLECHRVLRIMGLGLSGFVMQVTNSVVQIVCNASLQYYGGDLYVGVMTVMNSIREILTMPVMGLTDGATPVMSFNYGANEYGRVKEAMVFMSLTTIVYTFLSWLVLILFPEVFISFFNSDAKLMEASIPAIHLYFFAFFMMALQFSGQRVFVALGKAKQAVFFSIFRKIIIVVPLTLLLPGLLHNGVDGVFLAEPISNFIGGSVCFLSMLYAVVPELQKGKAIQKDKESA